MATADTIQKIMDDRKICHSSQGKNQLVITGASSNPGRVFLACLGEHIEEARRMFPGGMMAVSRVSTDTEYLSGHPEGVQRVICDLSDQEKLKSVFTQADTVLHIAGIQWSDQVVKAAAACAVRWLIVVHTCSVYAKHKKESAQYRQTENLVKTVCQENGIMLTILRPTMIYGCSSDRNLIRLIRMVDLLPFLPVVNGGRYTLQPVHYEDLGRAIYDVLMQEEVTASREFILSGERPVFLREMLEIIGENLGKHVRMISCPYVIAYPAAWILYLLTIRQIDIREKVQRLCDHRAFGHREATEAFGFHPRSFESGIRDEVQAYMGSTASAGGI